ncbi:DMT family transporter [Microbacterium invictum]|uniref:EamA family transporter n=1 Tax=Microbacterium invictum TaxID=515415 RepID=A0ABZ0VH55_9MICO|nr:EamA family transporter [Microbacterium invictum]WQB71535.1 EamA family transporter [Microbacterium invictum]
MHVLAVLAAAVLFGTTGTSQALGPDDTTPLSIGVMRMVIGGTGLALLAGVLARRHAGRRPVHAPPAPRPGIRPLLLMTVTGICLALYQPLFFLGTERNGVAVGTVVALGSAPVLAGLLEWLLTRRLPTATWALATGAATIGVILLGIGGGDVGGSSGTDPVGLLGSLGAAASFAVIANVQRRLLDSGWDPFTVVAGMGASAALVSFPALPFVDVSWLGEPVGLAMALWLGLGTISVAYVLFTWGLGGLTAATAATLTLGEPLTAAILGLTLLGERLSALAVLGLIVLGVGLALLARGSRTPRDPRPFAVEG